MRLISLNQKWQWVYDIIDDETAQAETRPLYCQMKVRSGSWVLGGWGWENVAGVAAEADDCLSGRYLAPDDDTGRKVP